MDYEVRWTAAAADDLEAIITYLAEIDPHAAEEHGRANFDHIEVLRTFPRIGPRYKKRSHGEVREILCGKYRIFYRLQERSRFVEILRIFHGAREEPEFR
jgi:plasmid stabilization system protein ParE